MLARELIAFAVMCRRYWFDAEPIVRRELSHWEQLARRIDDPTLRAGALGKLRDAADHARLGATLATPAPTAEHARAVKVIVALEVLFDYLDVLTERSRRLYDGLRLHRPLIDPFSLAASTFDRDRADAAYLGALVATCRSAFHALPRATVVTPLAARVAELCADAQAHANFAPRDDRPLARWAQAQLASSDLRSDLTWWEFAAGATGSVVSLHALMGAAADRSTSRLDAARVVDAYFLVSALATLLDSVVDTAQDDASGSHSYVSHYADWDSAADGIAKVAALAATRARGLTHGAHHVMTVSGVAGYYLASPAARNVHGRHVGARVIEALGPGVRPIRGTFRAIQALRPTRSISAG